MAPRKPAGRRADAQLVAVLAARGNGKTAWLKQWLAANPSPRRVFWDTKREHGVNGTESLADAIRMMSTPTWEFAYFPTMGEPKKLREQFSLFCAAAYRAGRCQTIIEELAFVTQPSHAPPGWKTLLMLGRDDNHGGGSVDVIATAQRPASVDKDLLGNATLIHAGRLPYEDDAQLVARALGVDPRELQTLQKLHWIERGEADAEPRRGLISFNEAAAKPRALGGRPQAGKVPKTP